MAKGQVNSGSEYPYRSSWQLIVLWPGLWISWNRSISTIDTAISLHDRRG